MFMHRDIRHIHMTGICGTAMGAVATLLKQSGYHVTGSDAHAYPPMSTVLREQGIEVMEGFSPANLGPAPDLVIIGNAMSRGNEEVEAVLEQKLLYTSLAEALREFFIRGKTSLVVTGTHGKTTTSSMLAWVLESAGKNPGFMIGGVPQNFGVGARLGEDIFVSEGDEYDTAFFDKRSKFVHYLPDCVIVNNIEFDHADIFSSVEDIELSFRRMLNLVPRNGLVVINAADERVCAVTENVLCPKTTFSADESVAADWWADDIRDSARGAEFLLHGPPGAVQCSIPLHGKHNVSNALAVSALAAHLGLSLRDIADGFASFTGVMRRLQRLESLDGVTLYDDFAHHPTAIADTLAGVRAAHPDARIWAMFEPRSNTTVKNLFQKELADALGCADQVVIGKVHRREQIPPELRLDVDKLVNDLAAAQTTAIQIDDAEEIAQYAAERVQTGDVVVIMSNGAFGGLARILPDIIADRTKNL